MATRRGSNARESLEREMAQFLATAEQPMEEEEDDEDLGLVRRVAASSGGGESWLLDTESEETDYRDALLTFVEEGPGAWIEACGSASEKWRGACRRLSRRVESFDHGDENDDDAQGTARAAADAYRLERELWSLVKMLFEANLLAPSEGGDFDSDSDATVEIVELDTAREAAEREASSSSASRRRRIALEWLERGAEERIKAFDEEGRDFESDADAVEGVLPAAARDPASFAENLASPLETALTKIGASVEAEHDVARAAWTLCRAGRWEDAAVLDDIVGAHWRAAATRARTLPGYDRDGAEIGNPQRDLWRRCAAARAEAARAAAEALRLNKRNIEDSLARKRPRDKTKVAGLAAEAIDLAIGAAFYDAARHAALAADLPQLKAILPKIPHTSRDAIFEDAAWAHLLCLDDAAGRDASNRDAARAIKSGVLVAPSFKPTQPQTTSALDLTPSGLAAILDHVLDQPLEDDNNNTSKPQRFAQSKLACLGLVATPAIVDPLSPLGAAARDDSEENDDSPDDSTTTTGSKKKSPSRRRLARLCAHLGVAWKQLARRPPMTASDEIVDVWLADYAQRLADLGLSKLSAAYAARLDDPAKRISVCASCFASATSAADRIACVKAAEAAFAEPPDRAEIARLAAGRCIQRLWDDFDDDDDQGTVVVETTTTTKAPFEEEEEVEGDSKKELTTVILSERDAASMRALEWLMPFGAQAWSPCGDGVDLLRQANLLFRRWFFDDLEKSGDLPYRRLHFERVHARTVGAARALPKYVPAEALDSALDVARRATENRAAAALHEYASWRTWVRALERLASWRAALGRLRDEPPSLRLSLPGDDDDDDDENDYDEDAEEPQPRKKRHQRKGGTKKKMRKSLFAGGDGEIGAVEGLEAAAQKAKIAIELVVRFPGVDRVAHARWGPVIPAFDDDDDDDEDLAWRLDALTATLARRRKAFDAGWLGHVTASTEDDQDGDDQDDAYDLGTCAELRRRVLPAMLEALVHLCKDTGDAFAEHFGYGTPDASAWHARGIDVARIVADDQAGLIPDVLSPDDVARLLDRVAACAVELVRRCPSHALRDPSSADGITDLDWAVLLASAKDNGKKGHHQT